MSEKKGTISIHAQNIMPIIKKWLYSDKDIFVRELVSNGCDAIAKYKLLASRGEVEAEDDYAVYIEVDKENKAVSYTHLDVYKRQDTLCTGDTAGFAGGFRGPA